MLRRNVVVYSPTMFRLVVCSNHDGERAERKEKRCRSKLHDDDLDPFPCGRVLFCDPFGFSCFVFCLFVGNSNHDDGPEYLKNKILESLMTIQYMPLLC